MKTVLQVVLSLVVAVALLGIGFYVGSQPDLAAQLGLDSLLPAAATNTNASSPQTFRPQAGTGGATAQGDGNAVPADSGEAPAGNGAAPAGNGTSPTANGAVRTGNGFAGNGGNAPAFQISDDQLVEIVAASGAGDALTAMGTAAGVDQQPVLLPFAGTIQTVDVVVGDSVAAGDLLLTLDGAALEQAIEDALAGLSAAQANLDTLNADPVKNAASLPDAKQRVADARAKLEAAATDLGATQVVAPASGTILSVDVQVGEDAAGGTPALVLSTGDEPVLVTSDADQPGTGWLVPATAVQERNGNAMLFVVRDGQPTRVAVTKGAAQGESVVVESPELQAGDKVVGDVAALFQGGGFPRGGNFPGQGGDGANNGGATNGRGGGQTQPRQP